MVAIDIMFETVQTMIAIEENTDNLLKNVEIILDKRIEFSKEAETVQDAYAIARACFDTLVENVLEYVKAEKSLILENKKTCRDKLKAELKACE